MNDIEWKFKLHIYRDTLKLFLRFLKEEKGTSPNSFYIRNFKRELVIEFMEWYRNNGAGITAANQRPAALKAFSDYAQMEHIEYIAPYIIKKYVDTIRKKDATFPEHVHCHMFRHSKAMHMLEAGINIVYIRDFLGHEDISTTMVYVRADNRLKNDAVNALVPKVTEERDFPDWNKDKDLLQFLNSLK